MSRNYVVYSGDGKYIPGVPSRDMSVAEWRSLPKELRDMAIKAGTHKITKQLEGKDDKNN